MCPNRIIHILFYEQGDWKEDKMTKDNWISVDNITV